MSLSQRDQGSRTPRTRYSTPLNLDQLRRSESRRRKQLDARVRTPDIEQDSEFLPPRLDSWLVHVDDFANESRVSIDSIRSYQTARKDVPSVYETSHKPPAKPYWRYDFERPEWNDILTIRGRAQNRRLGQLTRHHTEVVRSRHRRAGSSNVHQANSAVQRSEATRPHSAQAISSFVNSEQFRSGSVSLHHPLLPNGQLYHPQLHEKRPDSVPNYSRPWSPDVVQSRRSSAIYKPIPVTPKKSKPPISYERVNGVYLDMKPRIVKEEWEGLTIPEIKAQDIMKLDHWLDKYNNSHNHTAPSTAEYEYTSSAVSHPARSPPPIGGKENSVRTISPQPPSLGRNHTFVSRLSWTAGNSLTHSELLLEDELLDRLSDDESVVSPPPSMSWSNSSGALSQSCSAKSSRSERAYALLTEVITGLFGSRKGHGGLDQEPTIRCDEDAATKPLGAYQHHSPNACILQARHVVGGYDDEVSYSQFPIDPPPPPKERYYSEQRPFRKPSMTFSGKNVMRLFTMRPPKIVEEV